MIYSNKLQLLKYIALNFGKVHTECGGGSNMFLGGPLLEPETMLVSAASINSNTKQSFTYVKIFIFKL